MADNESLVPGFDDARDAGIKISLNKIDGMPNCLSVILDGYIDTYNSNFFLKQLTKIVDAGFVNLAFNCYSLNYISSTGIGSFITFLKLIKPKGGDIVLVEIQPKVFEVFQLLGFLQFFNIRNSTDEAVEYFKTGAAQSMNSVFPKVFACPICQKKLKALRSGKFRCSECKSILAVDGQGQVFRG